MKKILVVRMSALGDIIHGMPAVTDIHRRWPDAVIDMAVDERFVEIPQQHRNIRRVISIPLKRLKRRIGSPASWHELRSVIRDLRQEHYDVVIDLHGLWKSALIARMARADVRVGFHVSQCAERAAAWFYDRHFLPGAIPSRVQWQRDLAAFATGSDAAGAPDYGLRVPPAPAALEQRPRVVFFHSVSRDDRCWPEERWIELGRALAQAGYYIELPWGSDAERQRAQRLCAGIGTEHAGVPQRLSMLEWVPRLGATALVVGVDSGLTHLAAATGTPCVALFTNSDPGLLVAQQGASARALGGPGVCPATSEVKEACLALLNTRKTGEWKVYEQKLVMAFYLVAAGAVGLRQLGLDQL